MFLLGIFGFVIVVTLGMMLSGDISMFNNVPSLLMVILPALLITLSSSSKQSRKNAFQVLFSEDVILDNTELNAAKHTFSTFGNMNMLMGWIGVIIGAIAMTANIESAVFGPAVAVCALTLLYALLIKTLCYAAEAKIQFKIINLAS
jgi:flagellar motor component MotA